MRNARIVIAVCLGLILIMALLVSRYVWLPDVVTGRVVVLSRLITTNGDNLRLVQFFNGDGYLTEFIHTDQTGRCWSVNIDPDAKKAWSGKVAAETNNTIVIRIWSRRFSYDLKSHLFNGLRAHPFAAYETPPGTPLDPIARQTK